MSERPYYLISARRLVLLREHLESKLADLARRWWDKPLTVEVQRLEDVGVVSCPPIRRVIGSKAKCFAMLGGDETWRAVAEQWLHCSVERSSAMAGWLEQRYIAEFFQAIFDEPLGGNSSESKFEVDAHPGAGQLLLTIRVANIAQKFLLPGAILPPIPTTAVDPKQFPLAQVVRALKTTEVSFEARLPSVQVSLSELMSLAPGDFLSIQKNLSGTLALIGKDIELTLPAELGRRNDYKAALVVSITEPS